MPNISILSLAQTASSSNSRGFPSTGHLGLTPVIIAGQIVITPLSRHEKPLVVSSVIVRLRCIESRLAALSVVSSRSLWESEPRVVWQPSQGREWEELELGTLERTPFELTVGVQDGRRFGRSSVTLREYKCVWKLEVQGTCPSLNLFGYLFSPFFLSL